METMTIDNRDNFGLLAIERAKALIAKEGSALAVASRNGDEDDIRTAPMPLVLPSPLLFWRFVTAWSTSKRFGIHRRVPP